MEHRPVFGAYLNMARHNAYITLSHISDLLGAGNTGNEARLAEMKAITILKKGKSEEKQKSMQLLLKHFPFLVPMIDNEITKKGCSEKMADPKLYHKIFTTIFNVLNFLRDQYSHHIFIDERLDDADLRGDKEQLVYYLKNCFDGARRVTKDRFGFSENDMSFLTGSKEGERYEKLDKGRRERDNFPYKLDTQEKTLSRQGMIFLMCLFLEKKYAIILLDTPELSFFPKKANNDQKKIIREIFSVYRMRLPKARIDSEKPDFALGLDMLNELKKCPDELFETLSPADQNKFRIQSDSDEHFELLMKRYQDRFPYFAMRYIDEKKVFDAIRFQVSLGKYRYRFYDKKGIDNDNRVRILQKELNGFGRLEEIEIQRKQNWVGLIRPFEEIREDHADEEPYITDQRANYVIYGNRIGMAINSDQRQILKDGCFMPEINGKETRCQIPDCWLSIHELAPMIFHHLLCDDKKKTEKIITSYVKRYRKLFSDIKNGSLQPIFGGDKEAADFIWQEYHLNYDDIPKKIRGFLTRKEISIQDRFNRLAGERIKEMISWSERRLKKLKDDLTVVKDRKNNKVGKGGYIEIKPGRLARFLSEDIIRFQPTADQGKDKLTGQNFQVMQSSLAIYDKSPEELKRMFISARLIGGDIPHPFLYKVFDRKNLNDTIVFYRAYLEERIKYLKGLRSEDYTNSQRCSFLYSDRQKWAERNESFYRTLSGRYLEQPIELPRGLFTEAIKELLKSKYSQNEKLIEALGQERCNTSFMITRYFEYVHEDGNQEFYKDKRTYAIFNQLENKRVKNRLQQQYYSLDELTGLSDPDRVKDKIAELVRTESRQSGHEAGARLEQKLKMLFNEYKQNEKRVRQYKVLDILLFMMSKKILIYENLEIADEIDASKLKDISLDSDESILAIKIPISIALKMKDGSTKTIRQEYLKIKNYGDFFRFIYDQRIKTLLPEIIAVEIDRADLERELEKYDLNRTDMFQLILEFEECIVSQHPDFENKKHNFKDLLEIHKAEDGDKEIIRLIRNAFCHNSYPRIDHLEKLIGSSFPSIAESLPEYFRTKCKLT